MFKKRAAIEVIGGQNLFPKSFGQLYTMKETGESGVVEVKGKKYYFLGVDNNITHERSAGKTAAGAVVGTLLAPGIGTIIGGAVGAKKKDTSTATLSFIGVETNQPFTVQIKCNKNLRTQLAAFKVSDYQPINGSSNEISVADELLKFKGLLDAGAITQDEYDSKKKELLGL